LYDQLADLPSDSYVKPITVLNRVTARQNRNNPNFRHFHEGISRLSEVTETWNVDTCQNWLSGLGRGFDQSDHEDVFWLIPGDFEYASDRRQDVLEKIQETPKAVYDAHFDLCLGGIIVPRGSSKQLIDTYGHLGCCTIGSQQRLIGSEKYFQIQK
jgi:hypothetical protein